MVEPQGSGLVDGVCCELGGGLWTEVPPGPLHWMELVGVQCRWILVESWELVVPLMKSRMLISCVALDEVPPGIYCCVRVLHVIGGKASDWLSYQWPVSVVGTY